MTNVHLQFILYFLFCFCFSRQPEQLRLSHTDEFEMITQCMIQLLHAQPALCEHLPSIGFLPSIIQALGCKSNDAIVASAIKILFALCKSDVCLQTFSTKCPQIISGFKEAMQIRRDHLGTIIRICFLILEISRKIIPFMSFI